MTNDQKKELAKLLFFQTDLTQAEIAERVDVRAATVSTWVQKEGWNRVRKSILATRQKELGRLYDQLEALNDKIMQREEGERYANNKEADIMTKLTASIRQLETETSLATVIDVFTKFNEFIRKLDGLDAAKQMFAYQDGFVKSLMK